MLQVQAFSCRGCVLHFDSLEEGITLDNLLAVGQTNFCGGIAGGLLDDYLPIP